jgi:hypothetical protein
MNIKWKKRKVFFDGRKSEVIYPSLYWYQKIYWDIVELFTDRCRCGGRFEEGKNFCNSCGKEI